MSIIQRAYKTELDLNNAQITACKKHAGAARWAYNWGLARKQEEYQKSGANPSPRDLHRELTTLKQTNVPWMYEVSKCAPQGALRNLDTAFAHFFRRWQLKQQGKLRGKVGYPQRKTKKHGLGSFRFHGTIVVCTDTIQLPRLGRLQLTERAGLPADQCSHSLGHCQRACGTLVRLGVGRAGTCRTGKWRAYRGSGFRYQDLSHPLGWHNRTQSTSFKAASQEAKTLAVCSLTQREGEWQSQEGGPAPRLPPSQSGASAN
jgi:hypothetical protein